MPANLFYKSLSSFFPPYDIAFCENVIEMLVFFTFVDSKYKDSVSINILPYQGIIYPYSPDIEVIAVTTLHLQQLPGLIFVSYP